MRRAMYTAINWSCKGVVIPVHDVLLQFSRNYHHCTDPKVPPKQCIWIKFNNWNPDQGSNFQIWTQIEMEIDAIFGGWPAKCDVTQDTSHVPIQLINCNWIELLWFLFFLWTLWATDILMGKTANYSILAIHQSVGLRSMFGRLLMLMDLINWQKTN